ncbi:MAG TPA: hypothetical protein PLH19_07610 [Anaerolineae bacterium]|nr:hypothetical protein [Anaerolineae bacterium]HQH38385.1 hypothetical protein [Anaerolineae bacterium]
MIAYLDGWMQVRPLDTENRRDIRRFVEFPFTLYADCPQWMPPLAASVKAVLDRRHYPFYKHSEADFFVAEEGRDVVGRIAVLENRRYNEYNQCRAAFFYLFDAIDDMAVAGGLFAAAAAWATRRGLDMLYGPKGFLRADAVGILVEGFEHRAALSMPYNYAYYPRLLEAAGFAKEIDYLSGYVTAGHDLDARFYTLAEKIKARRGFWVKSFTSKRELRAWIPRVQRVNNEAFTHAWGYYPLDDDEVQLIGRQLLSVADPRLMKIVMKGDDIAGFAFVFPDISDALKKTRGRLWPFGWIRILAEFKRTRRMCGNGIGLLPKYQGMGGSTLLYVELARTLKAAQATFCDLAQVLETNTKSLGDMNAIGVQWYKRHRVYRRALSFADPHINHEHTGHHHGHTSEETRASLDH